MHFSNKRKSGIFELLLSAVCLALTFFVVIPYGADILSLFSTLGRPGGDESVIIRLSASEESTSSGAENKIISQTKPLEGESEAETAEGVTGIDPTAAYKTPDDILKLSEEYLEKYKNEEPFGTVKEEFFGNRAATDVIGKVAVRNCTSEQKPDFEKLLNAGAVLETEDISEPTVLVFHTHTTESYLLADNGVFYKDFSTHSALQDRNVVRVGDEICSALESVGIGCLHDTQVYDASYNGAYSRSRETVLEYLEKYPSIKITLDVHRDAVYYSQTSASKPTAVINGRKAAQIMIITGAQEGLVSDFPRWEDNLRFALALQKTAQEKYEGLMKPVYFCQRKYNMDVTPCSLLLEFGSDANTLEEAVYSGRLLGNALGELIKEYEKK